MHPQPKINYDLFGESPRQPRHFVRVGGYASRPGTGPAGKTCRDCAHYDNHYGRTCALMKDHIKRGQPWQIRAASPACGLFDDGQTREDEPTYWESLL